jgi:predicted signal transduction protein with EAL and GGDEF domain
VQAPPSSSSASSEPSDASRSEQSVRQILTPRTVRLFGLGGVLCAGGLGLVALRQSASIEALALLLVLVAAGWLAAVAATHRRTVAAARIFAWTFLAAALAGMVLFGGVQSSAAVAVVSAVALCGVLLGRTALFGAALAGVVTSLFVAWGAAEGWLPESPSLNTPAMAVGAVIGNIVMIVLVFLMGQHAFDFVSLKERETRSRWMESEDTDPVSGALSLTALRRAVDLALQGQTSKSGAALLVIGLERGSLIRRGLGPRARDLMLRAVADRLRSVISPQCIVGRIADDEFAVLAFGVGGLTEAAARARHLAAQIQSPVAISERSIALRVRVGVVLLAPHHESSDDLLRDGHAALESAASMTGTSVGTYDAATVERAKRDLELDDQLAEATERGELVPFYQPIVSLEDGQLRGFEALVRWKRGDRFVSPGEFLPRAEVTGAVVAIDRLMLTQACRQLVAWDESYPEARPWVSVNLCAAQFSTDDLVDTVRAALDETGLEPKRLHLELTESGLTVDVQRTRELLTELKELGVVLALDDFGTGWSSLQYIQQYPMDVVKIDRSFISPISDAGGDELASTVIFMAERLGLAIVAEGIETRSQYRILREHGVAEGQGYHFSRPLAAMEASRYLQPWAPDEPSRAWDRRKLGLVGTS